MEIWSIEQFFSHFNKNGGEKIDAEEASYAKNSVFDGFVVEEGMTLEKFEEENRAVYQHYEENISLFNLKYKFEKIRETLDKLETNGNKKLARIKELLASQLNNLGYDVTKNSVINNWIKQQTEELSKMQDEEIKNLEQEELSFEEQKSSIETNYALEKESKQI